MTKTAAIGAFAVALLPLALQAQPQPAVLELMHYTVVTETCLGAAADASDASTCIGQAASRCMDNEQGGHSTVGMMFCLLAEKEAWDRLLNTQYAATMEGLRREDTQEAEVFPEFANRADSLRDAQRAWIPLRDADCALEYAMWGSGSMRQIAGADCLLQRTADRTIYLKFLGDHMR